MGQVKEPSIAERLDMAQGPSESRLSIPTPLRIPIASFVGFSVGTALGIAHGGSTAQLRFRAEHAHKMPTTTAGWYLYHKSKNYHAMFGGLREGFRMGAKLGFWTMLAVGLESAVDRYRGSTDLLSSVLASLTVAGTFSAWNRFSIPTAARTAKYGLVFGFVYGGMQDIVGCMRGRRIGYIEFLRKRFRRAARELPPDEAR